MIWWVVCERHVHLCGNAATGMAEMALLIFIAILLAAALAVVLHFLGVKGFE